jgi:hypothetical protein
VLDRNRGNATGRVQIEQGVLIEVTGLGDGNRLELDMKRIGICEASDPQGTNLRSKNALFSGDGRCTTSPGLERMWL